MKPYYADNAVTVYHGGCLDVLRQLPAESVNCCVTSPPYFGLRDYGHEGQIGLEPTPAAYVAKMVDVFREVRRVLRDDGTVWLNLGDSYAQNEIRFRNGQGNIASECKRKVEQTGRKVSHGLKPKDLIGIPWSVAFALRADGWYLRQDIIWHKPNPMPESVTDRCTKAHEYIFLLAKAERYYYDAEAIKEPNVSERPDDWQHVGPSKQHNTGDDDRYGGLMNMGGNHQTAAGLHRQKGGLYSATEGRNRRSVWTVTTKPYSGAHFATFPPDLIDPCVKAGCPAGGIVLDPFHGSGTTGQVARDNGCRYIGIELNEAYIKLSLERYRQGVLMIGGAA